MLNDGVKDTPQLFTCGKASIGVVLKGCINSLSSQSVRVKGQPLPEAG